MGLHSFSLLKSDVVDVGMGERGSMRSPHAQLLLLTAGWEIGICWIGRIRCCFGTAFSRSHSSCVDTAMQDQGDTDGGWQFARCYAQGRWQ